MLTTASIRESVKTATIGAGRSVWTIDASYVDPDTVRFARLIGGTARARFVYIDRKHLHLIKPVTVAA